MKVFVGEHQVALALPSSNHKPQPRMCRSIRVTTSFVGEVLVPPALYLSNIYHLPRMCIKPLISPLLPSTKAEPLYCSIYAFEGRRSLRGLRSINPSPSLTLVLPSICILQIGLGLKRRWGLQGEDDREDRNSLRPSPNR